MGAGSLPTLSEDDERRLAFVPTNNIDAIDRYFVGRQLLENRTVGSLQAAIEYFRQVTELDPDFALGWSGLADAYMLMPEYSSTADREIVGREASAAIDRALSLDPNLPDRDPNFFRLVRHQFSTNPHSQAWAWLSFPYMSTVIIMQV